MYAEHSVLLLDTFYVKFYISPDFNTLIPFNVQYYNLKKEIKIFYGCAQKNERYL